MSERPLAIVTGASAGIGRETAYELAKRGYRVVLTARREERLRESADRVRDLGGEPVVRPLDLAHAPAAETLVTDVAREFGRLDVLVNNAGFGLCALVHETDPQDMRDLFEVNYFALWHGCRAAAPIMIAQKRGHIFNVSSVLGKRGSPFNGAYAATKFAIVGLSDALRVELARHGVRVTTVCPALTETEFGQAQRGGSIREKSSIVRNWKRTPASHVARRMAAAIGKNQPEIVFTFTGRLLARLSALSPRLVDAMMAKYYRDMAGGW